MPGSNSTRPGSGSRIVARLVSLHEISAEKLIDVNSDSKAGTSDRANGMVQGKLHVPPIRQPSSRSADKPARGRPERFRHSSTKGTRECAPRPGEFARSHSRFRESMHCGPSEIGDGASGEGSAEGFLQPFRCRDQANVPSAVSLPASRIRAGKSGTTTLRGPSSPITPSRFRADICRLTVSMVRPR